jgi:hypothetical protein
VNFGHGALDGGTVITTEYRHYPVILGSGTRFSVTWLVGVVVALGVGTGGALTVTVGVDFCLFLFGFLSGNGGGSLRPGLVEVGLAEAEGLCGEDNIFFFHHDLFI